MGDNEDRDSKAALGGRGASDIRHAQRRFLGAVSALADATRDTWDVRLGELLAELASDPVLSAAVDPLRRAGIDADVWWEAREADWGEHYGRGPIVLGQDAKSSAAMALGLLVGFNDKGWPLEKYLPALTGISGSWPERVARVFDSLVQPVKRYVSNILEDALAETHSSSKIVSSLKPVERLFLSHAAVDRACAELLKNELEASIPGLRVFQTSIPGMIVSGADWIASIKEELELAQAFVVLLTPHSVERPWIWFETGAAWMSKRPMATVCAGKLNRSVIPMPLGSFHILSLEEPQEASAIFVQLGGYLSDPVGFAQGIGDAWSGVQAASAPGWSGIEIGSRYFAWEGPNLHSLPDWPGRPTPIELINAVRGIGLTPSFGVTTKLTRHLAEGRLQVFETDRRSWRAPLLMEGSDGDQVLLVREGQPLNS